LQILTKFLYIEGFGLQNYVRTLRDSLVSSSEYLLLAAVVKVAVRTVTLPNLLLFRGECVCWFCSDCCWSL